MANIEYGLERITLVGRIWLDAWLKWKAQNETTKAFVPASGYGHLFVGTDTVNNNTHIYFRDDDNVLYDLCHPTDSAGTVINNTFITNVNGVDHLHGLAQWFADGVTAVFNLPDYAEYVQSVSDDGIDIDHRDYTLHKDRDRITLDFVPIQGNIVQAEYVIARI